MGRFRRKLVLSGLAGLLTGALLASGSAWLVMSGKLRPPFPYRIVEVALVILLGGLSLAEIPLMLFALRRISTNQERNARTAATLNGFYVLFAAVYGVPVGLLTGNVTWTLFLSAFCIIRFATSLAFVREPAP